MNKNIKKAKRVPLYEFGTLIENPNDDLVRNQIAIAKAQAAGMNNSWSKGMKIFGNLAGQVGQTMMSKGIANGEGADGKGIAGFLAKNNGIISSAMNMGTGFANSGGFAFGGEVPVEVEGEEVGETPSGQLLDFVGPAHEDGGIDVALPPGTEMYSKRIKVDGVTMADRKKKRERKTVTLESLLKTNNTDALIKNSLKRTTDVNKIEEDNDNKIQQVVKQIFEGDRANHAYGNPVLPLTEEEYYKTLPSFVNNFNLPGIAPAPNPLFVDNMDSALAKQLPTISDDASLNVGVSDQSPTLRTMTTSMNREFTQPDDTAVPVDKKKGRFGEMANEALSGFTLGDGIGLAGTIYSTFAPMKNTKANRAGDTPNVNAYANYGKEGLKKIDESKKYINQVRDSKLKDLEVTRSGSIRRNRNSARGVNTMRALDLATDAAVNKTEEETYNSFAEAMTGILSNEAGMLNDKDRVVMAGEQAKDTANRQDRDNYFTQLAQDIATKGRGLQEIGKDLNTKKQNKVMMNLLNQLSAYGITIDDKGNLSNKKK